MKKLMGLLGVLLFVVAYAHGATGLKVQVTQRTATVATTATLTWGLSPSCVAPVTCTANVYRVAGTACPTGGVTTGVTWTQIATSQPAAGPYTDSNPGAVGANCYYVTDVATGNGWVATESGVSNTAQATFPVSSPTGLVAVGN